MMLPVAAKVFIALGAVFVLACLWAGFCRGDAVSQTAILYRKVLLAAVARGDAATNQRSRAVLAADLHSTQESLIVLGRLAKASDDHRFDPIRRSSFLATKREIEADISKRGN